AQNYRKKVPPPTPDGREGRLFPPEQSLKTLRLLIELAAGRNKILGEFMQACTGLAENMSIFRTHHLNLSASCDQTQGWRLRVLAWRVLVLHAQSGRRHAAESRRFIAGRSSQHARSKFS